MNIPNNVQIVDVGPRDGFQMEQVNIPTDLKVKVIDAISQSGVSKIEATSFVSASAVPQMSDAAEVMSRIRRLPNVQYTVLVPNRRGAELALEAEVDAVRIVICATETYNQRNVRMSIDSSLKATADIVKMMERSAVPVEVAIAVSFGCPFEGRVPGEKDVELAKRFSGMGIEEISIADTIGLGNPRQVKQMSARLQHELSDVRFSLHIHNTRGLGFANVLAGFSEGIDIFDASIGGLGGCPVVPSATGNIPTEDLVNMCDEMGIGTGVDVGKVMEASRLMQSFLNRRLPSHVLWSGTTSQVFKQAYDAIQH